MGEMNARFATERERRLAELDAFYAQMRERVIRNALSSQQLQEGLAQVEAKRRQDQLLTRRELELEQLDFEHQIALKRAELFAETHLQLASDKEQYQLEAQLKLLTSRKTKLKEVAETGGEVKNALVQVELELDRVRLQLKEIPIKRMLELGSVAKSLFSSLSGVGGELGQLFGGLASQVDSTMTSLNPRASKMDRAMAGIQGIVQLISMAGQQARENAEAVKRYADFLTDSLHRAALARIEALGDKESNIFGVGNPYAKAVAGAKQYRQSLVELSASLRQMEQGQVQVGTRKVVSGKNIAVGAGAGATAGAAIGSFIPVVGNLIGAGVGALIGGLFGATRKKVVPLFQSLSQQFGSILKEGSESFELNPKILQSYASLDDATKMLVDNWEEIRKKALEAQKEMEENFKALSGDLGTALSKALSDGLRSGDISSALRSFDEQVSGTIHSIMEQQLFATYFQRYFDELSEGMKRSFDTGGDGDIKDDIKRFARQYKQGIEGYKQAWKEASAELEREGFESERSERTAVAHRGLAQASQDSIDELMGIATNQLLQLRTLAELQKWSRNEEVVHLALVRGIARNVETIAKHTSHLERLEVIATELARMSRDGVRINA